MVSSEQEEDFMEVKIEAWIDEQICLIERSAEVTPDDLKSISPDRQICAVTLPIAGLMGNTSVKGDDVGAITFEDMLIVTPDIPQLHHRPTELSTTIACDYVWTYGALDNSVAVVNNCGTDAVLAALILSGRLQPDPAFKIAAVAAATGTPNIVSDVLESLAGDRDLNRSVDVLMKLLQRLEARKKLQQHLLERRFKRFGSVALILLDDGEKINPALLPDAVYREPDLASARVIVAASRMSEKKWHIDIRLGLAAEPPMSLEIFDLPGFDLRWNEGVGITDIDPEQSAQMLNGRLIEWGTSHGSSRRLGG